MRNRKKKDEKKGMIIRGSIVIIALVIFIICLFVHSFKVRNEKIKNHDYSSMLEEYLVDFDEEENKDCWIKDSTETDFKSFVTLRVVGQEHEDDITHVYAWALVQNFYIKDNQYVRGGSGSAMPYKFSIKDNKVINVEVPEEGERYEQAMKELFPESSIEELNKLDGSQELIDDIVNQAKDYYKDKFDENNLYGN